MAIEAYQKAVKGAIASRHKKKKKRRMKGPHPGFENVQEQIAKREGVSKERAGAMLAAATRRASPGAKKKNPRLKRVKG